MNENLILSMAKPYVENSAITYEQFNNIYDMLSLREQYAVSEILYRNGILLVDGEGLTEEETEERTEEETEEEEQIAEAADILETDGLLEDEPEEFQVLYDEGLFQDSHYAGEDENNLIINRNIKQSNEILCVLIQQGNKQAEQDLCLKNKKLVDKYVAAYQKRCGYRLDFDDLEQVGFMGLIKAAKKFEIQRSAFSTYAVWWIKQAISREITDNGYAIRLPAHMMEKIGKVTKMESLNMGLDRKDRIKKIAEDLSMTEESVEECLALRKNFMSYASLDTPIGDEEDTELGDLIPEEEVLSVEEIVMRSNLRDTLEEILSTLPYREQMVLRFRFGFEDGRARTLEEVGTEYMVSPERIRQIEVRALRKIRKPSRANKLKDFLEG